jgi:hypothetical protein
VKDRLKMDASLINAFIYEYLSTKDKILAETVKTKLKAVSIIGLFARNQQKIFSRVDHIFSQNAFLLIRLKQQFYDKTSF